MTTNWVLIGLFQALITLVIIWLVDAKPRPIKVEVLQDNKVVGAGYCTPINDTIQLTINVGGQ